MIDLDNLLKQKQETASIEFKSEFDGTAVAWLEIIKDIVGMANSGGGLILFGFDSKGKPSNKDISIVSTIDPAVLTDKIHKHTSINFSNFKIVSLEYQDTVVCVYEIGHSEYPIIFTTAGNSQVNGKTVPSFQVGTVYFRHGAKTEPADNQDIRQFLDKKIERTRGAWLDGIRKVVEAPEGSVINVMSLDNSSNVSTDIHLTNDPSAPNYTIEDIDKIYPLRGKLICNILNNKFSNLAPLKNKNILDANDFLGFNQNRNYIYRQKDAIIKYSSQYLKLLMEKYSENPNFFIDAKSHCLNARRAQQL